MARVSVRARKCVCARAHMRVCAKNAFAQVNLNTMRSSAALEYNREVEFSQLVARNRELELELNCLRWLSQLSELPRRRGLDGAPPKIESTGHVVGTLAKGWDGQVR